MAEKNWLYPPKEIGLDQNFELMEKAARMVINKDKEYPTQQFGGIGSIAKAVYDNRIFPFRFTRLFKARKGQILGGAISRAGILLVYNDFMKRYTWDLITSCKVTKTTIVNNTDPNRQSYFYEILLGFGEDEEFKVDGNIVNFFEFGGRWVFKVVQQREKDAEHTAELFAIYYNRVRSERMGIALTKGDKKIFLHHEINPEFAQEVSRRYSTPEGVYFHKILGFKRLRIAKDQITLYKRRGKKIEAIINWTDIADIHVVIATSYKLWIIRYKSGVEYTHEFIWPSSWKLEPKIIEDRNLEQIQQQIVLPFCWLETL